MELRSQSNFQQKCKDVFYSAVNNKSVTSIEGVLQKQIDQDYVKSDPRFLPTIMSIAVELIDFCYKKKTYKSYLIEYSLDQRIWKKLSKFIEMLVTHSTSIIKADNSETVFDWFKDLYTPAIFPSHYLNISSALITTTAQKIAAEGGKKLLSQFYFQYFLQWIMLIKHRNLEINDAISKFYEYVYQNGRCWIKLVEFKQLCTILLCLKEHYPTTLKFTRAEFSGFCSRIVLCTPAQPKSSVESKFYLLLGKLLSFDDKPASLEPKPKPEPEPEPEPLLATDSVESIAEIDEEADTSAVHNENPKADAVLLVEKPTAAVIYNGFVKMASVDKVEEYLDHQISSNYIQQDPHFLPAVISIAVELINFCFNNREYTWYLTRYELAPQVWQKLQTFLTLIINHCTRLMKEDYLVTLFGTLNGLVTPVSFPSSSLSIITSSFVNIVAQYLSVGSLEGKKLLSRFYFNYLLVWIILVQHENKEINNVLRQFSKLVYRNWRCFLEAGEFLELCTILRFLQSNYYAATLFFQLEDFSEFHLTLVDNCKSIMELKSTESQYMTILKPLISSNLDAHMSDIVAAMVTKFQNDKQLSASIIDFGSLFENEDVQFGLYRMCCQKIAQGVDFVSDYYNTIRCYHEFFSNLPETLKADLQATLILLMIQNMLSSGDSIGNLTVELFLQLHLSALSIEISDSTTQDAVSNVCDLVLKFVKLQVKQIVKSVMDQNFNQPLQNLDSLKRIINTFTRFFEWNNTNIEKLVSPLLAVSKEINSANWQNLKYGQEVVVRLISLTLGCTELQASILRLYKSHPPSVQQMETIDLFSVDGSESINHRRGRVYNNYLLLSTGGLMPEHFDEIAGCETIYAQSITNGDYLMPALYSKFCNTVLRRQFPNGVTAEEACNLAFTKCRKPPNAWRISYLHSKFILFALESLHSGILRNPFDIPDNAVGLERGCEVFTSWKKEHEGEPYCLLIGDSLVEVVTAFGRIKGAIQEGTKMFLDLATFCKEHMKKAGNDFQNAKTNVTLDYAGVSRIGEVLRSKQCELTETFVSAIVQVKTFIKLQQKWSSFHDYRFLDYTPSDISLCPFVFECFKEELTQLKSVDAFLQGVRFIPPHPNPSYGQRHFFSNDLPVFEYLQYVFDYRQSWGISAEANDDWFFELRFFIANNSELFKNLFRHHLNDFGTDVSTLSGQAVTDAIQQIVADTVATLRFYFLCDDEMTLQEWKNGGINSNALENRSLLTTENSKQDLAILRQYFQVFFSHSVDITSIDINAVMERLRKITILFEYTERLPSVVKFLKSSELCFDPKEINAIDLLERKINPKSHDQLRLREVDNIIDEHELYFPGLQLYHLDIIKLLGEAHPLFVFFQSELSVLEQIRFLTQDMQGNEINQEKLNNLSMSFGFLSTVVPRLVSAKQNKPISVESVKTFSELLAKESRDKISAMYNAIESCIKSVPEFSTWFNIGGSNPEKVVRTIDLITIESPQTAYIGYSPSLKNGAALLQLQYITDGESKTVEGIRLLELVRAASIVLEDETNKLPFDQIQRIKDFILSYRIGKKILRYLSEAESLGKPEYQSVILPFGESIDVASLGLFLKKIKGELQKWNETVKATILAGNRITLFSNLSFIYALLCISSKKTEALLHSLYVLFPEIDFTSLSKSDYESLVGLINQSFVQFENEDICKILVETLKQIGQKLTLIAPKHRPISCSNQSPSPRMIMANNDSFTTMMKKVISAMGEIPFTSQLLWCNNDTNKSAISRFLDSSRLLPNRNFAFMNINQLNSECREFLLYQLLTLKTESSTSLNAAKSNILLVFSSSDGNEAFSLYETITIDADMIDTGLTNIFTKKNPNLSVFQIVHGSACNGKSTYIQNQINNVPNIRKYKFSVHCDPKFGDFVVWYQKHAYSSTEPIGIHFDLLANKCIHQFSDMLFNFLYNGILIDSTSGQIVVLNSTVQHYIYLELPTVKEFSVSDNEHDIKAHPYLSEMADFSYLANFSAFNANPSTVPLIINADTKLVAYYLEAYRAKTLNIAQCIEKNWSTFACVNLQLLQQLHLPNRGNDVTTLTDEEVTRIITEFFTDGGGRTIPNCYFFRAACIKLLAIRFKFIPKMRQHIVLEAPTNRFSQASYDILVITNVPTGSDKASVEDRDFIVSKKLNSKDRPLLTTYFTEVINVFIHESVQMLNKTLKGNWAAAKHPFTIRSKYDLYEDNNPEPKSLFSFNILCTSIAENEQFPEEIKHVGQFSCTSKCSDHNNTASPGLVRARYAPIFSMESHDLLKRCVQNNYVLTPDFGVKMHIVHERLLALLPTILEGQSGTGKTEMMEMMSILTNANPLLMPNSEEVIHKILTKIKQRGGLDHNKNPAFRVFFETETELIKPNADPSKTLLFKFLSVLEEKDDASLLEIARPIILRYCRRMFRQFPLLNMSDYVNSVLHQDKHYRNEERCKTNPPALFDSDSEKEISNLSRVSEQDKHRITRPIAHCHELGKFLSECFSTKPKFLCNTIKMHNQITPNEFREEIKKIIENANEAAAIVESIRRQNPRRAEDLRSTVIVFIDEMNTTKNLSSLIKEVFLDHTLDGKPLPENIFWVGAINPATTVKTDREEEYAVFQMSPPMDLHTEEFSSLTEDQECNWIRYYLEDPNLGLKTELNNTTQNRDLIMNALKRAILFSQQYIRSKKINRITISIRDMLRTVHFYKFLLTGHYSSIFLPDLAAGGLEKEEIQFRRSWQAALVSLALSYCYRLNHEYRAEYIELLKAEFAKPPKDPSPQDIQKLARLIDNYSFEEVLQNSFDKLWKNTRKPPGIAGTKTMKENLYLIVICEEACLPLIIKGPPGTGKTLSFQISCQNMKGSSSPSEDFRKLKYLQLFTYQCSAQSSAAEIKDVYETAKKRCEKFIKAGIDTERCVVFLDEAGLTTENKLNEAALKAIHYYTDKAVVASVLLTNTLLDASKNNRAILLLQESESNLEDRNQLAAETLLPGKDLKKIFSEDSSHPIARKQITGLSEAFSACKPYCDYRGHNEQGFHQRDFIFLCRYIYYKRGNIPFEGESPIFDESLLLNALRRTFNGISEENFNKLVKCFLTACDINPSQEFYSRNSLESLKSSLADELGDDEEINQSHFRHVMLLDPSVSNNAISALFDLNILKEDDTEVFYASDFPEDTEDINISTFIGKVMNAVKAGKTIILANCSKLVTAFFDLVNKHYTPMTTRVNGKDVKTFYANVSLGSFSRPCIVHPKAKLIMHISLNELPSLPVAFLNRFDKFMITSSDSLSEKIEELRQQEQSELAIQGNVSRSEYFNWLWKGVQDFEDQMAPFGLFYGLVPQDTAASLVLRCLSDTIRMNSSTPLIRNYLGSSSSAIASDQRSKWVDTRTESLPVRFTMMIQALNFQLLQIARPEKVFLSIPKMPALYVKHYFRQEHFSACNILNHLITQYKEETVEAGNSPVESNELTKYDISTRTTSDLAEFIRWIDKQNDLEMINLASVRRGSRLLDQVFRLFQQCTNPLCKRILLVMADKTEIKSENNGYLNSVRDAIDLAEKKFPLSRPLIVIINHFSFQSEKSNCDCTFSNDWEYIYCDSFMDIGSVMSEAVPHNSDQLQGAIETKEDFPTPLLRRQSSTKQKIKQFNDARKWLDVAFRLSDLPSTDELTEEFFDDFINELHLAVISATSYSDDLSSLVRRGIEHPAAKALYSNGGMIYQGHPRLIQKLQVGAGKIRITNRQKECLYEGDEDDVLEETIKHNVILYRCKSLEKQKLVMQELLIRRYILKRFLALICHAWGRILPVALRHSAETMATGRNTESFLHGLVSTKRWVVRAFSRLALEIICNNYGAETIFKLPTDEEIDEYPERPPAIVHFLSQVIQTIPAPSMEDLQKYAMMDILSLSAANKEPAKLPLFSSCMKAIEWLPQLEEEIEANSNAQSQNQHHLSHSKYLQQQQIRETNISMRNSILSMIAVLESSEQFYSDFVHDFVCCSLNYGKLLRHELNIITKVVMIKFNRSRIVQDLVKDSAWTAVIHQVLNLLSPLRYLYGSKDLEKVPSIYERLASFAENEGGEVNHCIALVESEVIDHLLQIGKKVMEQDDSPAAGSYSAVAWISTIRLLTAGFDHLESLAAKPAASIAAKPPAVGIYLSFFWLINKIVSHDIPLSLIWHVVKGYFEEDYLKGYDQNNWFKQTHLRFFDVLNSLSDNCPLDQKETVKKELVYITEDLIYYIYGNSFENSNYGMKEIIGCFGNDLLVSNQHTFMSSLIQNIPLLVQIEWVMCILSPCKRQLNDELEARGVGADLFLPNYIVNSIQMIRRKSTANNTLPLQEGDDSAHLATLVFQAQLERLRRDLDNLTKIEDKLEKFWELNNSRFNAIGNIVCSATAVHIAEFTAHLWSCDTSARRKVNDLSDQLLQIFALFDGMIFYFLTCLRSTTELEEFLSDRTLIQQYNLNAEQWYVSRDQHHESLNQIACRFPFAGPEDSFERTEYLHLIQHLFNTPSYREFVAWCRSQKGANRMYLARMMYFVALYSQGFCRSRQCAISLEFLNSEDKALLDINPKEQRVYELVSRTPHSSKTDPEFDGLAYLFSQAAFNHIQLKKDQWLERYRHCAANVMAMLLGSPRDRSYYYMACFEHRIHYHGGKEGSFGLGSAFSGYSVDCGYRVEFGQFNDVNRIVIPFQDIARYRAMNNYMIWISVAWGHWLHDVDHDGRAMFARMIAYKERFENENNERFKSLPQWSKDATCLFIRANSFLSMLEFDPIIKGKSINPVALLTLCCYETTRQMTLATTGEAPQSFFSVVEYETIERAKPAILKTSDFLIEKCWEPCFQRACNSSATSTIAPVQALITGKTYQQTNSYRLEFPSASELTQIMTKQAQTHENHDHQENEDVLLSHASNYISQFLEKVPFFQLGKHTSFLVDCYKWFHKRLAYRLTNEEMSFLTIQQVIETKFQGAERTMAIKTIEKFERVWNKELRPIYQTFSDVCAHGRNANEHIIPPFDYKENSIQLFLSQSTTDEIDLITRMLHGRLLMQQNEHLTSALSDVLSCTSSRIADRCAINELNALCDNPPRSLDVAFLPTDNQHLSKSLVINVTNKTQLMNYLLSHATKRIKPAPPQNPPNETRQEEFEWSFDATAVIRGVISTHVANRPLLNHYPRAVSVLNHSQQEFHSLQDVQQGYLPDRLLKMAADNLVFTWKQSMKALEDETDPSILTRMRAVLSAEEQDPSYTAITSSSLSNNQLYLLREFLKSCRGEVVITEILSYLITVIGLIKLYSPLRDLSSLSGFVEQPLAIIITQNNNALTMFTKSTYAKQFIKMIENNAVFPIRCLPSISYFLIDWYQQFEYLFPELYSDAEFSTTNLPNEVIDALQELQERIIKEVKSSKVSMSIVTEFIETTKNFVEGLVKPDYIRWIRDRKTTEMKKLVEGRYRYQINDPQAITDPQLAGQPQAQPPQQESYDTKNYGQLLAETVLHHPLLNGKHFKKLVILLKTFVGEVHLFVGKQEIANSHRRPYVELLPPFLLSSLQTGAMNASTDHAIAFDDVQSVISDTNSSLTPPPLSAFSHQPLLISTRPPTAQEIQELSCLLDISKSDLDFLFHEYPQTFSYLTITRESLLAVLLSIPSVLTREFFMDAQEILAICGRRSVKIIVWSGEPFILAKEYRFVAAYCYLDDDHHDTDRGDDETDLSIPTTHEEGSRYLTLPQLKKFSGIEREDDIRYLLKEQVIKVLVLSTNVATASPPASTAVSSSSSAATAAVADVVQSLDFPSNQSPIIINLDLSNRMIRFPGRSLLDIVNALIKLQLAPLTGKLQTTITSIEEKKQLAIKQHIHILYVNTAVRNDVQATEEVVPMVLKKKWFKINAPLARLWTDNQSASLWMVIVFSFLLFLLSLYLQYSRKKKQI